MAGMDGQVNGLADLAPAIAELYRGDLGDFIRRRDALAKELRTARRRDDASAVKALRKPSRMAWALDAAAVDHPDDMDSLLAAARATLDAHSVGGDVRAAMAGLRAAVRDFATRAASLAAGARLSLDAAALANAVLAVLARPESMDQLRRGCLVEVPEAGGLDFLAALPAMPRTTTRSGGSPAAATPAPPAPGSAKPDAAAVAAARKAVRVAGEELARARESAESARLASDDIAAKLAAAEARLRHVEEEVNALRARAEKARTAADHAAARLTEAETSASRAERQLRDVLDDV